jgi:hypothetical protein
MNGESNGEKNAEKKALGAMLCVILLLLVLHRTGRLPRQLQRFHFGLLH